MLLFQQIRNSTWRRATSFTSCPLPLTKGAPQHLEHVVDGGARACRTGGAACRFEARVSFQGEHLLPIAKRVYRREPWLRPYAHGSRKTLCAFGVPAAALTLGGACALPRNLESVLLPLAADGQPAPRRLLQRKVQVFACLKIRIEGIDSER
jgi:hypothetical protein